MHSKFSLQKKGSNFLILKLNFFLFRNKKIKMFFIKKIFFSIMFTMMFQTFDASRRRFPRNDAEVSQKLLIENISELYACLEDNPYHHKVSF